MRAVAFNGVDVIAMTTDVTQDAYLDALANLAFSNRPVGVLMNNAGIGGLPTTPWSGIENWHRLLDVNFHGMLRGLYAFVPRMIEANRAAVIINIGSKKASQRRPVTRPVTSKKLLCGF